jgi:hypothetical protein
VGSSSLCDNEMKSLILAGIKHYRRCIRDEAADCQITIHSSIYGLFAVQYFQRQRSG